jgi:hypothetical protein
MPFQFPDPAVSTTATLPNGEEWEYVNGSWRAKPVVDNDQQQIDELNQRVSSNEQVNALQSAEIEQNEELLEPVNSALVNLSARLDSIETLDVASAVSALALAQQDIIELKSKVNTLELTSFLIME